MNSTAIPLSRRSLTSRPSLMARIPYFITLVKPRVMALALFTRSSD
jgi:protoheme IX farnesyltransferase